MMASDLALHFIDTRIHSSWQADEREQTLRLGHEVTSQTQAVQSTAVRIPACDWLQFGSIQSDTSCTKYCCQNTGL